MFVKNALQTVVYSLQSPIFGWYVFVKSKFLSQGRDTGQNALQSDVPCEFLFYSVFMPIL